MHESVINGWSSLERAVRESSKAFGGVTPWWRGQSDLAWKLVAPAHRGSRMPREANCLLAFKSGARAIDTACPTGHDVFEWLVLARHHGLHTRLLDWSTSLLSACHFAIEDSDGTTDATLWALSAPGLNRAQTGGHYVATPQCDEVAALVAPATGAARKDEYDEISILPVIPDHRTPRMRAQGSTFTIHDCPDPLEDRPGCESYLRRYRIPATCHKSLRNTLRSMGISRASLFPDLDALAAHVNSTTFGGDDEQPAPAKQP